MYIIYLENIPEILCLPKFLSNRKQITNFLWFTELTLTNVPIFPWVGNFTVLPKKQVLYTVSYQLTD